MYERRSRLSVEQQNRLLEYFVVGRTARAAGEVMEIQANTAIRFFMHLRHLIASQLPSYELSWEVEADESYFGGVRKGKRGRGAAGKVAVFGLSDQVVVTTRSHYTLYQTRRQRLFFLSFKKRSNPIALFTPTRFAHIMRWMYRHSITCGLIIPSFLQTRRITSMALRIFGIKPKDT